MPKSIAASLANPLVLTLAYDGLCTFEFGIAVEIFGLPRPELGANWYRFGVVAIEPGPLRAAGGLRLSADAGLDLLANAGTIVVPGWKGIDAPVPDTLCCALRAAHDQGARLLSICSGAFVLAACGLLDGKRATIHWRYADALTQRYPAVQVHPDVLSVDEGTLITSAGSAAGIDACLHLVRRDYGAKVANQVARRLVVPPHRDGGQAQFVERPVASQRESATLGGLFDWMRGRVHEDLSIERLALQAHMSKRTFIRRFTAATGVGPGEWLTSERVERAKELLEVGETPIDEVADRSGFSSAAALRHHFRRRLGVTPSAYRRAHLR